MKFILYVQVNNLIIWANTKIKRSLLIKHLFRLELFALSICNFLLNNKEEDQKVQGIPYLTIEEKDFKLSDKIFKLQSITLEHSQQCMASIPQIIYKRNKIFLQAKKIQIENLIKDKYQLNKSDNQAGDEVLKPNDYAEFISSFYGYDILHYGFQQLPLTKTKYFKNTLKKIFDNIVKDARNTYEIPSSKKKYKKRARSKYRLSSSSKNQNTKSNQKKLGQSKSFPDQLDDDEDSDYKLSPKKIKK